MLNVSKVENFRSNQNAMEIHLWLLHLSTRGRTGKYRKLKLFRDLWWHKQTAPNLADTYLHDLLIPAVSESLKSNILSDFFSAGLLVGALLQRASSIYGICGQMNFGESIFVESGVGRSGCKGLNSKKECFTKVGQLRRPLKKGGLFWTGR